MIRYGKDALRTNRSFFCRIKLESDTIEIKMIK